MCLTEVSENCEWRHVNKLILKLQVTDSIISEALLVIGFLYRQYYQKHCLWSGSIQLIVSLHWNRRIYVKILICISFWVLNKLLGIIYLWCLFDCFCTETHMAVRLGVRMRAHVHSYVSASSAGEFQVNLLKNLYRQVFCRPLINL